MSPDKDDDVETKVQRPHIKPRDWIWIGSNQGKRAVVSQVYSEPRLDRIEVVYLDERDRAICEDVVWEEANWEFQHSGVVGGYADKYSRLSEFVSILRRGRDS